MNRKSDGDGNGTTFGHERPECEPSEGLLGGMKATQDWRGRGNFMTLGLEELLSGNQSSGGSSAWGSRLESWSPDIARPRLCRPGSQGKGWEKGLSPESSGPDFQGGGGRPRRIQRWSPAADPLLTCTKSTRFMDNCQPVPARHVPRLEPENPAAQEGTGRAHDKDPVSAGSLSGKRGGGKK